MIIVRTQAKVVPVPKLHYGAHLRLPCVEPAGGCLGKGRCRCDPTLIYGILAGADAVSACETGQRIFAVRYVCALLTATVTVTSWGRAYEAMIHNRKRNKHT